MVGNSIPFVFSICPVFKKGKQAYFLFYRTVPAYRYCNLNGPVQFQFSNDRWSYTLLFTFGGKLKKSETVKLLKEAEINGFIRGIVGSKLIEGYDKDGDEPIGSA